MFVRSFFLAGRYETNRSQKRFRIAFRTHYVGYIYFFRWSIRNEWDNFAALLIACRICCENKLAETCHGNIACCKFIQHAYIRIVTYEGFKF